MVLPLVTFTGLDAKTDAEWVGKTLKTHLKANGYSAVEFAILRSPKVDQSPRYPSMHNMKRIMAAGKPGDFAFHLCGSYASMVLSGEFAQLRDIIDFDAVGRVQVNAQYEAAEFAIMQCWRFSQYIGKPVIMQWRKPDFPLVPEGLMLLQDLSGGTGKRPQEWFNPSPLCARYKRPLGYAGGLSAANITTDLRNIERAANGQPYWLDMESSLRDSQDWFSYVRVEQMLKALVHLMPKKFHPTTLETYGVNSDD